MIAILVALTAASCFAASAALQHRSAEAVPGDPGRSGFWGKLLRDRWWLLGTLTGGIGFALHALALHYGALSIVQPVLISGLVLTLPVRAALDHRLPSRQGVAWATVLSAGLALFLVFAKPTVGHPAPDQPIAALFLGAGTLLAAAMWIGSRRSRHAVLTGLLLGAAGGILLGLTAGVAKVALTVLSGHGPLGLLTSWPLYTLVLLGGWGVILNQRAYQAAPLVVAMPVLNVFDPAAAMAFGAYVFGEKPADQPMAVALEMVGLALTAAGMVGLTRSEQPPRPEAGGEETGNAPLGRCLPTSPTAPRSPAGRGSPDCTPTPIDPADRCRANPGTCTRPSTSVSSPTHDPLGCEIAHAAASTQRGSTSQSSRLPVRRPRRRAG